MCLEEVDDSDMGRLHGRLRPEFASAAEIEHTEFGEVGDELPDKTPASTPQALAERAVVADEETACTGNRIGHR